MQPTVKSEMPIGAIVAKLKLAKTDKQKIKIIKDAWNSDSESFFISLDYLLNPIHQFNLKTVPFIEEDDGEAGSFSFRDFVVLVNQLESGTMNSEETRSMINDAAMRANVVEWNHWYRRVLLKTLPDYISAELVRTALDELTSVKKAVK